MVPRPAQAGLRAADRSMGVAAGRESGAHLCAAHEDQMGKLQPAPRQHPPQYILVHEMAHLLEPSHNARFVALLDRYLPNWKLLRDELNRWPLGHVTWDY
jgi:hypothetical protein